MTTRPFYWSIRREVWENRSIYLAPLIVTVVVLFASFASMVTLPKKVRNLSAIEPSARHEALIRPFSTAPAPIMFTTFLVGMFYALDALYGERRDRSILFWKSLPVSDATTVLSKAAIPIIVLPAIGLALSIFAFVALLFQSALVFAAMRTSPGPVWAELNFVEEPVVMVYGLVVHALWYAPIYGWLLLISAWAKRTPFLWAVLPPFALAMVERMFNSRHFASFLRYRWMGAMQEGFVVKGMHPNGVPIIDFNQLTPGRLLTSAGFWSGLLFAAACLVAAVRLRRSREPI